MDKFCVYSDLFGFINAKITAHPRIAIGDNATPPITRATIINPAINVIAAAIKKRGMLGYLINKYKTQSMEAMIDAIASAFSIGSDPNNIGKCGDTCGSIKNEIPKISAYPIKISTIRLTGWILIFFFVWFLVIVSGIFFFPYLKNQKNTANIPKKIAKITGKANITATITNRCSAKFPAAPSAKTNGSMQAATPNMIAVRKQINKAKDAGE